jgi:hypothetical protein
MPLSKSNHSLERKQVSGANPLPLRRFPPPWSVEEQAACFVVKDSAEQKVCIDLVQRKARRAKICYDFHGAPPEKPLKLDVLLNHSWGDVHV